MKLYELFNEKMVGTYVGVKFTRQTTKNLVNWIEKQHIPNPVREEDLHTTLLISPHKHVDWQPKNYEGKLRADPSTYCLKIFGSDQSDIILAYEQKELSNRNKEGLVEFNLENKYGVFIPHVTLSYNAVGADLSKYELPTFPLYFSHEYSNENNQNWVDKYK